MLLWVVLAALAVFLLATGADPLLTLIVGWSGGVVSYALLIDFYSTDLDTRGP